MNQLLISLTGTSDFLSDAAFKIFRVPQNSIQFFLYPETGAQRQKSSGPRLFSGGAMADIPMQACVSF